MMISNYDPLITVNEKIGTVSDSYQITIKQITNVLNDIINQTEKQAKIKKDYCEICLVKHVKFYGHHVGGRYNDFRQITVCGDCHDIVTEKQKLDSRIWTKGNSDGLKRSFFLKGLYDVLILMSQKRNNSLYADIANLLTNTIYSLQRNAQN